MGRAAGIIEDKDISHLQPDFSNHSKSSVWLLCREYIVANILSHQIRSIRMIVQLRKNAGNWHIILLFVAHDCNS